MICLYLTAAEASNIAATVTDPDVLDRVCSHLRLEEVFVDVESSPKTVVFRDDGVGLRCAAIAYEDSAAADLAWEQFWQLVLVETSARNGDDVSKTMPGQKPGRSKQTYCTPPAFLSAVKRRFGIAEFAIDLAADADNAVAPLFYTEAENALVQPWRTKSRELAWLNPPFADLAQWVEKAWNESRTAARVAMLVPAGVGSNWWRDWVDHKAFVLLLNGRITFVGETMPYPKDCCLLIYGPDVAAGYEVWAWAAKKHEAAA